MRDTLFTYICLALAVICGFGALSSWENILGTHDQLLGFGAALMLVHVAYNPEIIRQPFKVNTIQNGKLKFIGRIAILFLILGVIETTQDWTPDTTIRFGTFDVVDTLPLLV